MPSGITWPRSRCRSPRRSWKSNRRGGRSSSSPMTSVARPPPSACLRPPTPIPVLTPSLRKAAGSGVTLDLCALEPVELPFATVRSGARRAPVARPAARGGGGRPERGDGGAGRARMSGGTGARRPRSWPPRRSPSSDSGPRRERSGGGGAPGAAPRVPRGGAGSRGGAGARAGGAGGGGGWSGNRPDDALPPAGRIGRRLRLSAGERHRPGTRTAAAKRTPLDRRPAWPRSRRAFRKSPTPSTTAAPR